MDVVNYAEGARIAGVSRNMISKILKLHNNKEAIKSYFVFNPKGGKPGINIDDKTWVTYVNKVNKQRSNQNRLMPTTNLQPTGVNSANFVNKNTFAKAVILAIKETFDIPGSDLKKLGELINFKYEEMS